MNVQYCVLVAYVCVFVCVCVCVCVRAHMRAPAYTVVIYTCIHPTDRYVKEIRRKVSLVNNCGDL